MSDDQAENKTVFHIGRAANPTGSLCGVPVANGWRRDTPPPTKGTICEECRRLFLLDPDFQKIS